jgi:hypothetical protein
MARTVLLDNEKEALALLESALAAGELGKREAETWPLFADLRKSRKFQKALTRGIEQAEAAENASEKVSLATKKAAQKDKTGTARRRSTARGVGKARPKATNKAISSSEPRSRKKAAQGSGKNKKKS